LEESVTLGRLIILKPHNLTMKSIEPSPSGLSQSRIDEPVPAISDNIVFFINQIIFNYDFSHFIEYGMGNSTRYFLKIILDNQKKVNFISTEFDPRWYFKSISLIQNDFYSKIANPVQPQKSFWPYSKCNNYIQAYNTSTLSIPQNLQRLEKGKRKLAGRYGFKFLFYRLFRSTRPYDAVFSFVIADTVNLNLILRRDFIKDQYGESPVKDEYINAPLKLLLNHLNQSENLTALFLIDGGPRHDILKIILDIEDTNPNFLPIIFLCDANRNYYHDQTQRRAKGIFIQGSNMTLNKLRLYTHDPNRPKSEFTYGKDDVTDEDLADKEVWYYNSAHPIFSRVCDSAA
jgi:hypothetical protein